MEPTKEQMLEIAERKEKCIKCDTEKHICIACDNFVCANKVWREEIAFYEHVREMLQADAEGRLMVLPCKVVEDEESDLTKALRCLASQDPNGDCFMEHENLRRYETGERRIECLSNPVEGERCPFHQSTYDVCFEDGDCMEWLKKAADEIIMLRAALEKMGGGEK